MTLYSALQVGQQGECSDLDNKCIQYIHLVIIPYIFFQVKIYPLG